MENYGCNFCHRDGERSAVAFDVYSNPVMIMYWDELGVDLEGACLRGESFSMDIDFCPMCGRRLSGGDEEEEE